MGLLILRHAGPATALPCPIPLHDADPHALMKCVETPWDVRTLWDVLRMVLVREVAADCRRPKLCSVREATVGSILS